MYLFTVMYKLLVVNVCVCPLFAFVCVFYYYFFLILIVFLLLMVNKVVYI